MTDPHRLWLRPIKVLEEREAVRRPDANGEVSAPGRKRPGAQLGTEGAKGVHVIRRHAGNPCDGQHPKEEPDELSTGSACRDGGIEANADGEPGPEIRALCERRYSPL